MGQTAAATGTPPLERIPRDRTASLELVRITEAAAIAAAHWMGHGNNTEADQAAVEAMRKSMEDARFNGTVVIGEGERDEAPMLFIGERVGRGDGPEVHIAVDPLEGTNPVAKGRPNAVAVMAISEPGGLLHAPDTYMEKLVVGPPARGKVDLDRPVAENLKAIAQSLNRDVSDLTIVILDRPRHEKLMNDIRFVATGVTDGEVLKGVHFCARGARTHSILLDRLMGKLRFIDTTHFEDIEHPPIIRLE